MNRLYVMLISMGLLVGGLPEAEAKDKCSGWIAVESVPAQGGSVVLDGVETTQKTPATLKDVPCGLHEVGIALEDYRDFPRRLRVKKNQVHKVRVKLRRYSGRLLVDTLPYAAQVKIDGKPVGRAPISKKDFPAGEHTIVAEAEGFDTQTRTIRIKKDHTTVVELNLKEPAASSTRINAIKGPEMAAEGELELVPLVPPEYKHEKKKKKEKKKTVVAKKSPPEIDKKMGMKPDGSLIRLSDPNALELRARVPPELSTRRTWAWITAGTATTAAVASVVLFAVGASTKSDADSLAGQMKTEQNPYRRQEIQSRVLALDNQAARQQTGAWVCAGVFAAAAGISLYLFLSEPDDRSGVSLTTAALPGGGWVGVQGRF
jgi:hypothetical protein